MTAPFPFLFLPHPEKGEVRASSFLPRLRYRQKRAPSADGALRLSKKSFLTLNDAGASQSSATRR